MVRLSGNASTALPAMSVTVGSIVFVGQVTIISLFVIYICFHCNINNSHVFRYNRINFINFHYVFVAGESAVEAYSCILHMFVSSFVVPSIYYHSLNVTTWGRNCNTIFDVLTSKMPKADRLKHVFVCVWGGFCFNKIGTSNMIEKIVIYGPSFSRTWALNSDSHNVPSAH